MKKTLFYFGIICSLSASVALRAQETVTFQYKPSNNQSLAAKKCYGQIQSWKVPNGVTKVKITATGGGGPFLSTGAKLAAEYNVTAGKYLNILVGASPTSWSSSGGGGTFVTYEDMDRAGEESFSNSNNVSKLILAAGGAGSDYDAPLTLDANPTTLNITDGSGNFGGIAGGNGGFNNSNFITLPNEACGGYGGGGAYGFSGGSTGGSFGGKAPTLGNYTYGGGGGFSGGSNFEGGTSWIANDSLGVIAGVQAGNISSGEKYNANGSVVIEYSSTLATGEVPKHNFIIYPNPAINDIYIYLTKDEEVKIYSIDGKLTKSQTAKRGSNKIDISRLQRGNYILSTSNAQQKFIKK